MIRSSGIEPNIIHYLDTPPDRDVLIKLIAKMKNGGVFVDSLLIFIFMQFYCSESRFHPEV